MYLFVKGHVSWDEVLDYALVEGAICNVWCLKRQLTDLLLEQLLRQKRILSNTHSGPMGQSIAVVIVQCLGTMEG